MDYPGRYYYRLFQFYPELQERRISLAKYGLKEKISERLVQVIWYDQRIKKDSIKLDDRRKIRILYPGRWNTEEGPDFKGAQIIIGQGKKLNGDIEVHLLASDWFAHKHHENKVYDSVVLHVCLLNDLPEGKELKNSSGKTFPQLSLYPYLEGDIRNLNSLIDPQDYPYSAQTALGSCHTILSSLSIEQVTTLLDWAGEARMGEKINRLAAQLIGKEYNQLLYEGIMEALGYKNNKEQFRQLAQRAHVKLMQALIKENEEAPTLLLIQSWLLGLAGFLNYNLENINEKNAAEYDQIERLMALWLSFNSKFKLSPVAKDFWVKSQRPANSPARRLIGMSHILARADSFDLVGYFDSRIEEPTIDKRSFIHFNRTLKEKLISPLEDFWGKYYKPGSIVLEHQVRTIGQSRAMVIIVNILIPFFLLLCREQHSNKKEMFWWGFYQLYPRLPNHSINRLMTYRLFGKEEWGRKIVNNAQRQFGLMQIFNDFCSQSMGDCNQCNFKKALEQKRDYVV